MMGINIPDMIQIIKEYGCVPIPVDYDLNNMAPSSWEAIKEACTDKVRQQNPSISKMAKTIHL